MSILTEVVRDTIAGWIACTEYGFLRRRWSSPILGRVISWYRPVLMKPWSSWKCRSRSTWFDWSRRPGLMFGFAVDETENSCVPISLSHKLVRRWLNTNWSSIETNYLRPNAKSQVTVEYDENDQPVRVDTVVISITWSDVSNEQIHSVINKVIKEVIPAAI